MAAGTAYAKRYGGGFIDGSGGGTPIDSTFLNAVETALLQLLGAAPTADGQVAQWDNANTRFGPALLLNKNIDPAAAIAKSKLDLTGANGIVNADIAAAAAIARSKLDFGAGLINADISAAAGILASKLAGYPNDVTTTLRGDGTWTKPAMNLICDSVAGGAVASFDTNTILSANIPTQYKHLRIYVSGRTDNAVTGQSVQIRFNNDSGANYAQEFNQAAGAGVTGNDTNTGGTSAQLGNLAGASATAGFAGVVNADINDYNNVLFNKTFAALSAFQRTTANGGDIAGVYGGYWFNTAAITRITVFPGVGNFIAGTRFSLYGIN